MRLWAISNIDASVGVGGISSSTFCEGIKGDESRVSRASTCNQVCESSTLILRENAKEWRDFGKFAKLMAGSAVNCCGRMSNGDDVAKLVDAASWQ